MRLLLWPLRSVRGRITLVSTALVALTLVLAAMLLLRLVREDLLNSAEATIDQALEQQAEQLGVAAEDLDSLGGFSEAWAVIDGDEVGVGIFQADPDDPSGAAFGELYLNGEIVATLVIDVSNGEVVEVFDPIFEEPLEDPEVIEQVESLVFEVLELSDTDGRFLVGATPLGEIEESVTAVEEALFVIVPALTLFFGLSTWLLVGRALRPVKSITSQVEAISTSSLDQRVPVPRTKDEVAELATVMNGMLDRLERGGERQRQFSADASHELRSPLSAVRAAAEMLGRNPDPARVDRLAEDIVAESDRMDQLIGDLLELSRLDEDRRSIALEHLDLVQLIYAELREEEADGTVEIIAPAELIIEGAKSQLRRLVRNLVDNAVRYAEGRVRVTVSDKQKHGSNVSAELAEFKLAGVVLTVEDDGPGIPPEEREAVFERFARLDEARGRDAGGTGLGLALVKAITERHGGTVTVDESPLGGARFTVTL